MAGGEDVSSKALVKESDPQSSWHPNSFQIFQSVHPTPISGLGFFNTAHVGVYGEEFFVCLPYVLLNLDGVKAKEIGIAKSAFEAIDAIKEDLIPDVFLAIHTCPPRVPSSKLISPYDDEFSVMFHPWLFPNAKFEEEPELAGEVLAGVFEPDGVESVWTDHKDGGMLFGELAPRSVTTHNGAFSPANCMLRNPRTQSIVSFVSVAIAGAHKHAFDHDSEAISRGEASGAPTTPKAILTIHILPSTESVDETLQNSITSSLKTIQDLKNALPIPSDSKSGQYLQYSQRIFDE